MAIGYACIARGIRDSGMRSCTLKNASAKRLDQIIEVNLETLSRILDYNTRQGITLFRISSDIIPLGSHSINQNHWWKDHARTLQQLGNKIRCTGMRVSMHPGQYTVLNALDHNIVERSVTDLEYHARFLDTLGINSQHKIILHTGGHYGDPKSSLTRFRNNFKLLSEKVQRRLVIENDEKFDIAQVLDLASTLGIPVAFDVFHHKCHPSPQDETLYYWLEQSRSTWKVRDGIQKIHYSQQEPGLRIGAHSHHIELQPFLDFYQNLPRRPLDIMLEVKDKDLSALKCIYSLEPGTPRHLVKEEWARYKYLVMEHSPEHYQAMEKLFDPMRPLDSKQFYLIVEAALKIIPTREQAWHTAQHILKCCKNMASPKEMSRWHEMEHQYGCGEIDRIKLKIFLERMARKYDQQYLLNSYYFVLD